MIRAFFAGGIAFLTDFILDGGIVFLGGIAFLGGIIHGGVIMTKGMSQMKPVKPAKSQHRMISLRRRVAPDLDLTRFLDSGCLRR